MPIYEYRCDNCRKVFEEWTRRADDNSTLSCHGCGGTARRIVSNTSFVLKGGGWYVTEYGNRKGASGDLGAPADKPAPAEATASGVSSDVDGAAKSEAVPKADIAKPQAVPSGCAV